MDKVAVFNWGAFGYDLLTRHELWDRQIAHILDYCPTKEIPLQILDLGCGPGVSTFVLARKLGERAFITGIDIAGRMIDRARHHHRKRFADLQNIRFQQADASNLPFGDNCFDLAVGNSFLYLVDDRLAVLREIHRVLVNGGQITLMEPDIRGSLLRAALRSIKYFPQLLRRPYSSLCFCTSMVLWRSFSNTVGQLSQENMQQWFATAGFSQVRFHPTLAGLGMHCVAINGEGEKK